MRSVLQAAATQNANVMKDFKFEHGDVLSFPDTDSEYVDVGWGPNYKVAETSYDNLVTVCKCGRGFRLKLLDFCDSEVFRRYGKFKNRFISLKEYLDYFGNFNDLQYQGELKHFEDFKE